MPGYLRLMSGVENWARPVSRSVAASRPDLWDLLCDGWFYPLWVVGASRMRDVDDGWPVPGSRLHHSVGNWPLLIDDQTEVLEAVPQQSLRLKAHSWPAGAAEVFIALADDGPGTLVTIWEDAVDGPGTLVPRMLRQVAMVPRNTESLRRLAFIAEGRVQSV